MFSSETLSQLRDVAQAHGIDPASFAAVAHIESGLRTHAVIDGRAEPLIRFEGHYFDRRLSGAVRDRARKLGLASPRTGAIANPASQAARWQMLARARKIDPKAADESVSWGMGQVMGAHWTWLGYASVAALVAEARSGVAGQLRLMARFIDKAGLIAALNEGRWTHFARHYNGPAFARNAYDRKLAEAHATYRRIYGQAAASPPRPLRLGIAGPDVRDLQARLSAAGFDAAPDGIFGPFTQAAVRSFQARKGLAVDGIAGPVTMAALQREPAAAKGWMGWLKALFSLPPRMDMAGRL